MSGGFELQNQIRHCKTVCIKRNLYLINYNCMRTQWTTKGNRDAGSSCLCDRGLHRYLQNFGGGLNTPNPPSRYATEFNRIWVPRLPGMWRRFDWYVTNDMKVSIRLLDHEDEGSASSETSVNIYQSACCSTQQSSLHQILRRSPSSKLLLHAMHGAFAIETCSCPGHQIVF